MKLQIDTEKKSITVEEAANLGELYKFLRQVFPNGDWKEFELIPTKIHDFQNPIIVTIEKEAAQPYYVPQVSPGGGTGVPWPEIPVITCDSHTGTYQIDKTGLNLNWSGSMGSINTVGTNTLNIELK